MAGSKGNVLLEGEVVLRDLSFDSAWPAFLVQCPMCNVQRWRLHTLHDSRVSPIFYPPVV